MIPNSKKIVFLQKRCILFVFSSCVLFTLFFSHALFANNVAVPVSAEELLFELQPKETADQSQTAIIKNLKLYLETVSSRDTAFVEKDKYNYSLSVLWLYHKWLDNQPERTNEYGGNWFSKTVKTITEWDGNRQLSEETIADFEQFLSLIDHLQSYEAQINLEKAFSLSSLGVNEKSLKQKYTIASTFTLETLSDLLKNIVYEDELILVSYKELDTRPHTVGLFKIGDNYYYYDPNAPSGEIQTTQIHEIANIILSHGSSSRVSFSVMSFDETSFPYPNQKDFLTKTNPSIDDDILIFSVKVGCLDCLSFFLEKGADPNKANDGWTALMLASYNGHSKAIDMLLEKGADPNQANDDGWTALMYASFNGHSAAVDILLEKGANPNQADNMGQTALMIVSGDGQSEVIVKLIEKGADPNQANDDGWTALMYASFNGHSAVVDILLEKGANPNQAENMGGTALIMASQNGHSNAIDILLEKEADPNQANDEDWTALMYASFNGHSAAVDILLEKGANPNQAENMGGTALMIASQNGYIEAIDKLIEKGANPNQANDDGWTALMLASYNGHSKAVDILLKKGADHDNDRLTALDIAKQAGHKKCVALLKKYSGKKAQKRYSSDQSQTAIRKNLELYLRTVSSKDVSFIKNFTLKTEMGYCHALSYLWLYYKWLENQPERTDKYGSNWFNKTVKTVTEWDGKQQLSRETIADFERFLSLIDHLQSYEAQINLEKAFSFSSLGENEKSLKQKYTIASTFTLESLTDLLENIVYEDELILVSYKELDTRSHTVGLFKIGDNYYYYDPNAPSGEIQTTQIHEIADIILSHGISSTVSFAVMSFDETPFSYPNQKDFLTQTNPSIDDDILIFSVKVGCLDCLSFFLEKGTNPNQVNDKGATALMLASYNGHSETIDMLIEKGADPNKADNTGSTALMYASENGQSETINKLIEKDADPNQANKTGSTALMCASENGHSETINNLIEKGADPNQANKTDRTALMYASYNGHSEAIDVLLEKGADPNIKDNHGHTALDIAKHFGRKKCVAILKKHTVSSGIWTKASSFFKMLFLKR
jgi:ankyrin repeat protein